MQTISSLFQWFMPSGKHTSATPAMPLRELKKHRRISYSPTLVGSLKDDHEELLATYGEIATLLRTERYDEISNHLRDFKNQLDVHLLNENLRFYCYLEEHLAGSPNELEIIKDFRRDMNEISRIVVSFLRKYRMAGVSSANRETFGSEYREIGAALTSRIVREESGLYSLYKP
ncbi:MAG: hemerythrin domain-containing protein [Stenotrophobium sp.]